MKYWKIGGSWVSDGAECSGTEWNGKIKKIKGKIAISSQAQGKIKVINLTNHSLTHYMGPEHSSHESHQHHPYAECKCPAPRAMCALHQDEPAHTVTVQGATCQTTQNLMIENAPAITKDIVMEPMGISTWGTQSIVPKTPVALATVPSLGPSVGSNIIQLVQCIQRGMHLFPWPIINGLIGLWVSGIHWSSHIWSAHVPRTHHHHFPEAPGILPEPCQPH